MFHSLIMKAVATIGAALIALGSFLSPAPVPSPPQLGTTNFNFVQAQKFKLAGSGVTSNASTVTLQSFKLPDASTTITMANFGTTGYGTLEPGTSKEEQVSFTGVTQNGDGTATLTGVTRGLGFVAPYASVSANQKAHAGGTIFVISNTSGFYSNFAALANDQSITGNWTFSASAIPTFGTPPSFTSGLQLVDKTYVDSVATSGAPDALVGTKGLVDLPTITQFAAGTNTSGTTASLVAPNRFFNATQSATTTGVVTGTNGKIAQGFLDLTQPFSFTGGLSSPSTTLTGTTTDSSTHTFTGSAVFNGTIGGTAPFPGVKLSASTTDVTVSATTTETNLFAVTVPGNTIGTSSVIHAKAWLWPINTNASTDTFLFKAKYGGTPIGSTTLLCAGMGANAGCNGVISIDLYGAGTTASQEGVMQSMFSLSSSSLSFSTAGVPYGTSTLAASAMQGASAIDSTSAQTLSLTVTPSTNSANQSITMTRFEVWKEQ